ncbi:hypothetical protein HNY73_011348 [Argiope bruennichi]|uniref:C2H2-type domain-containing protein n=1 Tax=Argiope bruennichi TaxID=94029 RepID=A0A8T0F3T8_ARGBR|nr:hypothetical protein HNY73_011348 [Argiope bruennichi]
MPKVLDKVLFVQKPMGLTREKKPYGCEFCYIRHCMIYCVNDHAVGRFEGNIMRCMFCEKRFRVKENFARHLHKIHLTMAQEIVWEN